MSEEKTKLAGPDFAQGVPISTVTEGAMLLGHTQGKPVILARRGEECVAIGAVCTHYNGPLAEGLLVDDTVRCPWHHACFSLRTGEALRAPALNPVSCWRVQQRDGPTPRAAFFMMVALRPWKTSWSITRMSLTLDSPIKTGAIWLNT
jgi:apoptosis-inducing factor 3